MPKKEKPLPKPPTSPFGRKRRFEEEEGAVSLIADEMARAMAEGKLDDFLKKEMPDSEYARKLSIMMLGMTGMLPTSEGQSQAKEKAPDLSPTGKSPEEPPPGPAPEGLIEAAQAGDVQGLMGLLKKEHEKRTSGSGGNVPQEKQQNDAAAPAFDASEKELIMELMEIASQNDLTIDWIVLRALKRYIEEYRKTGFL